MLFSILDGFNDLIRNFFSIDEGIQNLVDQFYCLPELVKILIIIGIVIVLVFGVFAIIKKILVELPKKILFILVCLASIYFILVYVL